ncbi:MAG: M20/M25/M40 family metallo-hydrolase, partial [Bdellovibrionales bacterium]|nr:M20/M25/M40 family metallo-hydrolase [Bdellovibrionales bacterium]
MNADGSDVRQITSDGVMSWAPFYHPGGDYIIYASNEQGFSNFELYAVRADGEGSPVRVTYHDGFDGLPVFSPNGMQLYWTRKEDGATQIHRADWDDSAMRKTLGLPRDKYKPYPETAPFSEQRLAEIRQIKSDIVRLSSPEMDGRLTGTEGERRATEYVAARMQELGLKPGGENGSYFQPFSFTAGVQLGENNSLRFLDASGQETAIPRDQWQPVSFSAQGALDASAVVFAGYGIVAANDEFQYDSYAHLDVRDKWVLLFRFLPEELPTKTKVQLRRYASLRYKAMLARERGARGILLVSGPRSHVREQLIPLAFDGSIASSSLGVLSITDDAARDLLAMHRRAGGSTVSLEHLQQRLDRGTSQLGFELQGVRVAALVDLVEEQRHGRNVIGILPGTSGSKERPLVIGAHVDHLGHGRGNNSLARDDESSMVHFGADDNASGVAALLDVARRLDGMPRAEPRRPVVFAAWSGEELGLLGSRHYIEKLKAPSEYPVAYLNMDMVGRLRDRLIVQATGSANEWPATIEAARLGMPVPVKLSTGSSLPTDSTSFYGKGIPVLNFFTGAHEEYHTPRDRYELINVAGVAEVVDLVTAVAEGVRSGAKPLTFVSEPHEELDAGRAFLRAYLGTIPDYAATDIRGVRLAGVTAGAPADEAGLREGD